MVGDEVGSTEFLLVRSGRGLRIVDGGRGGFVLGGLGATIVESW